MVRTFDTKLAVAILLVVATIIGSVGIAIFNTGRLYEDANLVSHTHQVIETLEATLSALKDAETGQRGYIITGEERYLEPYNSARPKIDEYVSRLERLTIDNLQHQQRIPLLKERIETRLATLEANRALRRDQGLEAARTSILSHVGKQQMDELRDLVDEMMQEERLLMRDRVAQYSHRFQSATATGLITAALGLGMVAAFVFLLNSALAERAQAAAAIHQQREHLRITLASIGDGVIATDAQGNITFLNAVAESLTGWTQSNAAGKTLEAVFHIVNETTRQEVDNPALRALKEGAIVGLANHTVLISQNGSERAIADSAAPIRGAAGDILGAVLVFRDVSEDRVAEKALAASEALKSAIVATALDSIITCNEQGHVVEFNPAAEQTFGYRREDVLGKELGQLIVPPSLRGRHAQGMRRYMNTSEPVVLNRRLELPALHADGHEFPVELAITRISGNGPPMFTAYLRDISDRKKSEAQLAQRMQLLSLTAQISKSLTTGETLHDVLQGCADALVTNLDGALARIWTLNEAEQVLELQASAGLQDDLRGLPDRVPVGELKIGIIAEQGKPYWTNTIANDPQVPQHQWAAEQGMVAFAGHPLIVDERVVGVVTLFARKPLEPHTLDVMSSVAGEIAVGIDRQQAIRAMQEHRKQLQVTLASIGDAVLTTDAAGNITFLNDVAQSLTGWTQADAAGQPTEAVFNIINERTGEAVENPVRRVLAEGRIVGLANHTILIAKDGARRPIDDSGAPIRLGDEMLGVVLVFRDVSERKAAEDRLKESEANAAMALSVGQLGTWDWQIERDDVRADSRAREVCGLHPVGLVKASDISARVHPDDRPRVDAALQAALDPAGDGTYAQEFRFLHEDDSIRWVISHGQTIWNNQEPRRPLRMIGTVVDISERKEADRSFRQLTERSEQQRRLYDTVLSNMLDLVYVFNLDHRFAYANQALLNMWGRTWDEAVGRNCLELGYEPWHAAMHDREIEQVVNTKQPIRGEVPFNATYGRRIYDYIFFPVLSADGEVESVAGVTRDVTERKQLEDNLRMLAADISEANRRKNEFLATLAHELRNPLAPIRTGLELIKMAVNDPATIEETRSMMERQTHQMVRLIDDLLDVSRITQGKLQLRKARIALADVVRSAVEATRPMLDEAGHQLTINIPSEPIYLDADPNRLAQVISNLLSNAAKYTKDRGQIWLAARCEGRDVELSVKDTGLGIPAEMMERIFEMFAQIDRPVEQGNTGLGIGLTLVKRLVEMHDGTIQAFSDGANLGSTFTVRLPIVVESSPQQSVSNTKGAESKTAAIRILVVDDNRSAAETLQMVLKIMGHEVRMAHDGLEAIDMARSFKPQLVFMDLGMPKLNGFEAAQRIRQEPWGSEMILVALTGWGQDEDKQRTREAGFDHHLIKPAEPAALQELIAKATKK